MLLRIISLYPHSHQKTSLPIWLWTWKQLDENIFLSFHNLSNQPSFTIPLPSFFLLARTHSIPLWDWCPYLCTWSHQLFSSSPLFKNIFCQMPPPPACIIFKTVVQKGCFFKWKGSISNSQLMKKTVIQVMSGLYNTLRNTMPDSHGLSYQLCFF